MEGGEEEKKAFWLCPEGNRSRRGKDEGTTRDGSGDKKEALLDYMGNFEKHLGLLAWAPGTLGLSLLFL